MHTLLLSNTTMLWGSLLLEEMVGSTSGTTQTGSDRPQKEYRQKTKLDRNRGSPVACRIFICTHKGGGGGDGGGGH